MKQQTKNILIVLGIIIAVIIIGRYMRLFSIASLPIDYTEGKLIAVGDKSTSFSLSWTVSSPIVSSIYGNGEKIPFKFSIPLDRPKSESAIPLIPENDLSKLQLKTYHPQTLAYSANLVRNANTGNEERVPVNLDFTKAECRVQQGEKLIDLSTRYNPNPIYNYQIWLDCNMEGSVPCDSDSCRLEITSGGSMQVMIPHVGVECVLGEKCEGTSYFTCDNNFWTSRGMVAGKCGVEPISQPISPPPTTEEPITHYRLENNQCNTISILHSQMTANDYMTLVECQSALPTNQPPTAQINKGLLAVAIGIIVLAVGGLTLLLFKMRKR